MRGSVVHSEKGWSEYNLRSGLGVGDLRAEKSVSMPAPLTKKRLRTYGDMYSKLDKREPSHQFRYYRGLSFEWQVPLGRSPLQNDSLMSRVERCDYILFQRLEGLASLR